VSMIVAVGSEPKNTLTSFAQAVGIKPPDVDGGDLEKGTALAWWKDDRVPPLRFQVAPSKMESVRHSRKYAEAELTPDRSFYFRGPQGKLNLRAQNLVTFLQLMDGVDEQTWLYHLRKGEYSAWFRKNIKDDDLADAAGKIERDGTHLSAAESRAKFRELIESRYTMPA
jgi:hypothetical protein